MVVESQNGWRDEQRRRPPAANFRHEAEDSLRKLVRAKQTVAVNETKRQRIVLLGILCREDRLRTDRKETEIGEEDGPDCAARMNAEHLPRESSPEGFDQCKD